MQEQVEEVEVLSTVPPMFSTSLQEEGVVPPMVSMVLMEALE